MQSNPFRVPPEALPAHDYCFYSLCWLTPVAELRASAPGATRQADLAAIAAYLAADKPGTEYISPFHPASRNEALCSYKMYQGWADQRIVENFPLTARGLTLPALRLSRLELERSAARLLLHHAHKDPLYAPAAQQKIAAARERALRLQNPTCV